ncbi:molecular chaperone DnaK [Pseudomaricurvus alkylphenolicus]|uniref:TraR/DksA family transcriptional regulator n=1 Tax=Pseudomaricurvus alkylphenolicus TaxID=1306991 RepID=UPI0014221033|nr:TraR/DksA C4-type zinc finger protein [Pseudomaricurvus alkylphenolicus]NIB41431.1 molecular chaperone DnaK [Pseudomaricurvus alkylphenolicus]
MNVQTSGQEPAPLTRELILTAPEQDYMNEAQLAFFRNLLLELHESTLVRIREAKQQMMRSFDASDDGDRAAWEEQSSLALRIADREQKLLPKIKQALERIHDEEFGYCLESGVPIGIPRLLARPTAEYCAEVKAIKEMKEHHYKG